MNRDSDTALEIIDAEKILVSDGDIRRVAEIMINPEIMKLDVDYRHHSDNLETMFQRLRDFFERVSAEENQLCLLAKSDGKLVGFLGIHRFSEPKSHVGDVGIMVHPDHQQKGIGTKLLKAGIKLARERDFKRLEADTLAENRAMRRTAEKAGFQLEGIRRSEIDMYGQLKDEALYALLL
ncbi:MAG: GNAT family protein [Candidatus Bathyarchaeota archaeon]